MATLRGTVGSLSGTSSGTLEEANFDTVITIAATNVLVGLGISPGSEWSSISGYTFADLGSGVALFVRTADGSEDELSWAHDGGGSSTAVYWLCFDTIPSVAVVDDITSAPASDDLLAGGTITVAEDDIVLYFTLDNIFTGSPTISTTDVTGDGGTLMSGQPDGTYWNSHDIAGTQRFSALIPVEFSTSGAKGAPDITELSTPLVSGGIIIGSVAANPANLSPDFFSNYERRHTSVKELPYRLDTGLLRGVFD